MEYLLIILFINIVQTKPFYELTTTRQSSQTGVPLYLQLRLIKAHGCMMLWAWFLLIFKGIFYMRYYKQFFANKRIFGFEIWFQVHRILNGLAFILLTIAIIATFAGNNFKWLGPKANSTNSTTPGLWHSMIGILAYSLVIFQLLSSFFRCTPSKKNRIIFSFIHRTLGILSFLMALVNIFIAVKYFSSLFSNPSGAINMIYCYYVIILLAIITNEIQIRFKIKIGLISTLGFLTFCSLIVCIYLTILIAGSL